MAVARTFECRGWTVEQYDRLMDELGYGSGNAAPGVLFHWAEATPEGVRATDVYESSEVADRLASAEIAPMAQRLGLPLPEITEHQVHNYAR